MKTVAIFGASEGGKRVWKALGRGVRVVAFLDNDPRKHGTWLCGIPIRSPAELEALGCDSVVIASMYAPQIYKQLREMGIGEARILLAPDSMLRAAPKIPRRGIVLLAFVFALGAGVGALGIGWLVAS